MNWIKKNQNTTLLLVFAFIGMIILLITYRDTTTYTNIKVHEGDTLWTLSSQHRGDLSSEEWVRLVKSENNMIDDKIIAGHTLIIPKSKQTKNITEQGIELASDRK
jgi:hypothetical protein